MRRPPEIPRSRTASPVLRDQVDRDAPAAVDVVDRPAMGAAGGERACDATHRQRALELDGAVGVEDELARLERELRMVAGVEELRSLDDVGAELGRARDVDRLDARAADQAVSVARGLEAG